MSRHINYFYRDQSGISDRTWVFNHLLRLGTHHNATIHITAITGDPKLWLTAKHSSQINSNWDHYFDIKANRGDPFHEIADSQNCREITNANTDLWTMFDVDAQCVNIRVNWYHLQASSSDGSEVGHANMLYPTIQPSRAVVETARRIILAPQNKSTLYGFIHIRRCDRMETNSICTEPGRVSAFVSQQPEVQKWFVFWYAEHGYKETLKNELNEVFPSSAIVFEEDLDFDHVDKHDNYFRSLVMERIRYGAAVSYETHNCHGTRAQESFSAELDELPTTLATIEDMYSARSSVQAECR